MSRDDKASYYDLELPDETVVEAQDVTRALLERAALPPYASKCLGTLLERVWRFGAKPGTDTAREAEKVVTEASFLCEALGGVPSFTLRDVARAAHDAGIEINFSCDDPAARIAELERQLDRAVRELEDEQVEHAKLRALHGETVRERDAQAHRIAELEHKLAAQQMSYESQQIDHLARVAELECELREARHEASRERELTTEKVDMVRDLGSDLVGARRELTDMLKRHDKESQVLKHTIATERAALVRAQADLDALRQTLDTERQAAVATAEELERVRCELSALRDRYRERKQVEEKAPRAPVLAWNPVVEEWVPAHGSTLQGHVTWTHQPPAPGEGEA